MARKRRSSNQAQLRERNLTALLRHLQAKAPLSRAQLAHITQLNKSTISSLVDELLAHNLIHETGQESSGGGRPATLLELNPGAGQIIGVELGADFIQVVLSDFGGHIVWREAQPIAPDQGQTAVIKQTLCLIQDALTIHESSDAPLFGLGLTLPGMVDVDEGALLFSPNLQWRDVPLRDIFQQETGLPVYVENDANAAALGESVFGVARQARNFIFLVVEVGIGSGLFLNGELYRGSGGLAGEIGHTNFAVTGNLPCRCGNRGCWETSSNQAALISRVERLLVVGRPSRLGARNGRSPLTITDIVTAAAADDQVALEALSETGRNLGLGIANLVNIFNPDLLVLGGEMSRAGEYLLPAINKVLRQNALTETRQQVTILNSAAGPDAIVIGAVTLVVNAILSAPRQVLYLESVPAPPRG